VDLAGRVALVTGAGRRLGLAIAVGLGRAGADVALHFHSSGAGVEKAEREIRGLGRRAERFPADLSDADAARGLAGRVVERMGRLDLVINSAAIMLRHSVDKVTPAEWDRVMDLNLRAVFFVSQGAIPALRKAKGKIVNIADVAAFETWPNYVPHCVSKTGVVALTQGLAKTLAPEIAVNAVAPGAVLMPDDWDEASKGHIVETTPLKRAGTPEDVVNAILFLVTGSDYVTGTTLVVDGGRLIR
jgi:pteridine reductase